MTELKTNVDTELELSSGFDQHRISNCQALDDLFVDIYEFLHIRDCDHATYQTYQLYGCDMEEKLNGEDYSTWKLLAIY